MYLEYIVLPELELDLLLHGQLAHQLLVLKLDLLQ